MRSVDFGFAVQIRFSPGYILLNEVCNVHVTSVTEIFHYNIAIKEKLTNANVLTISNQELP